MKDFNHAIFSYYDWLKKENASIDQALHIISLYESALNGMSNYLVKSIAKFDVFLIIVSIILSIQVCVVFFYNFQNIVFFNSTLFLVIFLK
jgi:hypothetical protein